VSTRDSLGWIPDGELETTPPVPDKYENDHDNGDNQDKVDKTLTTCETRHTTSPPENRAYAACGSSIRYLPGRT
jgi:hypothetical protein